MKAKELLPIGSVVSLKEANKKAMVIGIKQYSEKADNLKDYIGVMYPEGYLSRDVFFIFDHADILEVFHEGYRSDEQEQFFAHADEVLDEFLNAQDA